MIFKKLLVISLLFLISTLLVYAEKHVEEAEPAPAEVSDAQEADTSDATAKTSRPKIGIHGVGFTPIGEFSDSADSTLGFSAGYRYFLDKKEFIALYAGFGATNYASESEKFLGFEWTTATNMFFLEVGPQIHLGSGPVVPYIYGGVGFTRFSTTTTLNLNDEEIDSETHASDYNPAFSVGAGCYIRVSKHYYLDAGVTYQHNGTMTRLIDDEEITSEANMVRFHVGVSF